jgi:hypothetical protein
LTEPNKLQNNYQRQKCGPFFYNHNSLKAKSLPKAKFTNINLLFVGFATSKVISYISTWSTAVLSSQHSVLADLAEQTHVERSEYYLSSLSRTVSCQPNLDQSSLSCSALWSYSTAKQYNYRYSDFRRRCCPNNALLVLTMCRIMCWY